MNRMISFGYGYKDGKLIVVESEAEIVKNIFTDYINGKILKEIADELTIKGIDFFNGKCCWNKNMVFRIIENKKYIGEDGYVRGKFDIVNLRIHIVHVDFMRYFRIDKDVFVRVYYKMMLFRISVFV